MQCADMLSMRTMNYDLVYFIKCPGISECGCPCKREDGVTVQAQFALELGEGRCK